MLSHTFLNDISDVLQRWRQLLHLIVTQGYVIGKVTLVPTWVESLLEFLPWLFVLLLFIKETSFSNDCLWGVSVQTLSKTLSMRDLFKFILDGNLELGDLVLMSGDALAYLESLFVHSTLVQTLCMVEFILFGLRVIFGQLIIHICRTFKVLYMVVTVT